jgi:porin
MLERLSEPDRFLCLFLSDDRFAAAYMHISHDVSLLDEDAEHFGGQPLPIRSFEMVVEAIYEAHVKPGWLLQPFFQYVLRPAG